MKRHIAIVFACLSAFALGEFVYDATHPHVAEASGGGGGGFSGDIGTATGTRLALTQGVSASTGVFTSTNGTAITATGQGASPGGSFTGGATNAYGLVATGGGSNGGAINATATGTGHGVTGTAGGSTNSIGGVFSANGGGYAHGVRGIGGGASTSYAVWAQAGNGGVGLRAESTGSAGGYAGYFVGDTTSPVRALLHLEPQDAEPTGAHLVGDVYVTTAGVLRICTAAGTPGTWANVGSQ